MRMIESGIPSPRRGVAADDLAQYLRGVRIVIAKQRSAGAARHGLRKLSPPPIRASRGRDRDFKKASPRAWRIARRTLGIDTIEICSQMRLVSPGTRSPPLRSAARAHAPPTTPAPLHLRPSPNRVSHPIRRPATDEPHLNPATRARPTRTLVTAAAPSDPSTTSPTLPNPLPQLSPNLLYTLHTNQPHPPPHSHRAANRKFTAASRPRKLTDAFASETAEILLRMKY